MHSTIGQRGASTGGKMNINKNCSFMTINNNRSNIYPMEASENPPPASGASGKFSNRVPQASAMK